jgi:hypothetical protein
MFTCESMNQRWHSKYFVRSCKFLPRATNSSYINQPVSNLTKSILGTMDRFASAEKTHSALAYFLSSNEPLLLHGCRAEPATALRQRWCSADRASCYWERREQLAAQQGCACILGGQAGRKQPCRSTTSSTAASPPPPGYDTSTAASAALLSL